ncbi:MAG TPA: hypothetical protein VMU28_12175 [Terriglobales bacterium]|nr:hypothetical protein [Terriglobales bacterium]
MPPGERVSLSAMVLRRSKTYTSENGNVYQYYFVGKRAAFSSDPFAPATEFIFDVNSARQPAFAVSIFLPPLSVERWKQAHGRSLSDPEEYAAAKRKLFRGFDELEDVRESGRRLLIETQELEDLLSELGVD